MRPSTNKILAIAVILLLVVNIVLLIFIWKGKRAEPRHQQGNGAFETMAKELKMTEQQKNDYKKLRDEHFARVRPLFDSMRQYRTSFFKMVRDTALNDDSVNAYSKRVADIQAMIDKKTFDHFKKVRTLFSGDQQKQFDEYMQKMMQRRRDSTNRR